MENINYNVTAPIKSVRDWLRSCPLVDSNDKFSINYLGAQPTEYTVDDVPGVGVIKKYYGGALKQKTYVIASRQSYSADVLQNAANSGLFDNLTKWVETQNINRSYPTLGNGAIVQQVDVLSSGYLMEVGSDSARFQFEIQILYRERK